MSGLMPTGLRITHTISTTQRPAGMSTACSSLNSRKSEAGRHQFPAVVGISDSAPSQVATHGGFLEAKAVEGSCGTMREWRSHTRPVRPRDSASQRKVTAIRFLAASNNSSICRISMSQAGTRMRDPSTPAWMMAKIRTGQSCEVTSCS